ncbi:alpha/beta fold hydrolase [Actinoplanes sp. CA-142083]|uniref:alpha/beta fold hydrolase n=1 Tax=Actinoplanes sp. CA-142083 TaxID=3239903 RepID=UPI003D8D53D2
MSLLRNVVLVHGAFEDGSGWRAVHDLLAADGYRVTVVQNPTLSLAGDVLATLRVLRAQDGPCVLAGHGYGGAVITEAGTHDAVAALAFIAGYLPDAYESVSTLGLLPPALPSQDGFLLLDRERFPESFAADLPYAEARYLAAAQVPWGVDAAAGRVNRPAWRTKPSWSLVATDDRIIPAAAQREMATRAGATVVEVAASHAVHMSQPGTTADVIRAAALGVSR